MDTSAQGGGMLQNGPRYYVCGEHYSNESKVHLHIHGITLDTHGSARIQSRCPARKTCRTTLPVHTIVVAEARVPALRMRNFPLLALPRDVLAHVLVLHLNELDRYVLAHVCTALRALYGGATPDDTWRFRVWHDAVASTRGTALLDWLQAREPLTRVSLQYFWMWSCAVMRDSVELLCWLECHGVDFSRICDESHNDTLASAGCTHALEYMLRACDSHLLAYSNRLALAAAQYGRLNTLRWSRSPASRRLCTRTTRRTLTCRC